MLPPRTRRGLTFEQVEEAGVFAWRPDGYIYSNGRLLRIRNVDSTFFEVTPSTLDLDQARRSFRHADWRHLPGCACGVCEGMSASYRGAGYHSWWDDN